MKLTDKDEKNLLSLIEKGRTVDAVRFLKKKTGMTLLEAKKYIDLKSTVKHENYSRKDNIISENEERHISTLIKENEKLQAVAFLHKEKEMSLKEAKKYVDNKIFTGKVPYRRGFVFDEKLNIFILDLKRQKKSIKIVLNILLLLIIICPILFYFSDRTSLIKMAVLVLGIVWIPVLLILYSGLTLNVHMIEKRIKEIEEVELSNEFEVKSLRKNINLFFSIISLAMLIFMLYVHISRLSEEVTYKYIFLTIFLVGILIFNCYNFLKELKNRKYSLNINNRTVNILYNDIEVNSVKIDGISFVRFYTAHAGKGIKESRPTMQIFDRAEKKLLEMSVSIADYYLLKKYFTKNEVIIDDSYNIFQ